MSFRCLRKQGTGPLRIVTAPPLGVKGKGPAANSKSGGVSKLGGKG